MLTLNDAGLIASDHTYYDLETLLQQTGAYKAKRPVPAIPVLPTGAPEWHDAKNDATEATDAANLVAFDTAWAKNDDKTFFGMIAPDVVRVNFGEDPAKSIGYNAIRAQIAGGRKYVELSDVADLNVMAVEDFTIDEEVATITSKKTQKAATVHSAEIDQWKDGKIAKSWQWSNSLEFDAQMGTGPAAPKKDTATTAAKH